MRQPATTNGLPRLLQIIWKAKTTPTDEIERLADQIAGDDRDHLAPMPKRVVVRGAAVQMDKP
jgi:hypothetical protein